RGEGRPLERLGAAPPGAPPLDDADRIVSEVPQEPPEPRSAVPVRDDERIVRDARPACGRGEALRAREGMPARVRNGQIREIGIEIEERRAGRVTPEVEGATAAGIAEVEAALHENGVHMRHSTRAGTDTPPGFPCSAATSSQTR